MSILRRTIFLLMIGIPLLCMSCGLVDPAATQPTGPSQPTTPQSISFSFVAATSEAIEGISNITVGVQMTCSPATLVKPTFATVSDDGSGSATSGSDYEAVSDKFVLFQAGATSGAIQTVSIRLKEDSTLEAVETLVLKLTTTVQRATLGTVLHTISITDNDQPQAGNPTVAFSTSSGDVTEGTSSYALRVRLSTGATLTAPIILIVNVDVTSGNATYIADFSFPGVGTGNNGIALTFPIGAQDGTEQSVNVIIADDPLVEGSETAVFGFGGVNGGSASGTLTHTLTISDNDGGASVTVAFLNGQSAFEESDSTRNIAIVATSSDGLPLPKTFSLNVALVPGAGAALHTDYRFTPNPKVLTFTGGSVSPATLFISVDLVEDTVPEGTETLELSLALVGYPAGVFIGVQRTHTLSIEDDEPTIPRFGFLSTAAQSLVEDASTPASFTVEYVNGPGPLTADISVTVEVGSSSSASSGDFSLSHTQLVFPSGSAVHATQTFTITPTNDSSVEDLETIVLNLTSASGGAQIYSSLSSVSLGLFDDEIGGDQKITLGFWSASSGTGESGHDNIPVRVSIPGGFPLPFALSVDLADTHTGTARTATGSDDDYTFTDDTLTFAPPAARVDAEIQVVHDYRIEPDETVILKLQNLVGRATLDPTLTTHTITIGDDDKQEIKVEFISTSSSVVENAGTLNIPLRLSIIDGPSTLLAPVVVNLAGAGGVAVPGTDFEFTNTSTHGFTVTFATGSLDGATVNVVITLLNDSTQETTESHAISLDGVTSTEPKLTANRGASNYHTFSILNDDGVASLSIDSPVAFEGDNPAAPKVMRFTVTASALASGMTVDYTIGAAGDTAIAGGDYIDGSGTLTFLGTELSKTIDVTLVADDVGEAFKETLSVTLSNPVNATFANPADAVGVGTLVNDDSGLDAFGIPKHVLLVWSGAGPYDPILGVSGLFMPPWVEGGGAYDPTGDAWYALPSFAADQVPLDERANANVAWCGGSMLVWAGLKAGVSMGSGYWSQFRDGAIYDSHLNQWASQAGLNTVPDLQEASPPYDTSEIIHIDGIGGSSMTWTGEKFVLWGGGSPSGGSYYNNSLQTGAIYDPVRDRWETPVRLSTVGPVELFPRNGAQRHDHVAIYWPAQNKVIIWGGGMWNGAVFSDGWVYDIATDTFSQPDGLKASAPNAPSARWAATAIWTGSKMIVWGGMGASETLSDGAAYDPATDTWQSLSGLSTDSNRPAARCNHAGIWTGSKMVVWGGCDLMSNSFFNDGGVYDPSTDTWSKPAGLSGTAANTPLARADMAFVWTGKAS